MPNIGAERDRFAQIGDQICTYTTTWSIMHAVTGMGVGGMNDSSKWFQYIGGMTKMKLKYEWIGGNWAATIMKHV